MTNYLVHTTLMLANGTVIPVPVKMLSDRDGAAAFAKERQEMLARLMGARLVAMSGENQAEDLGLTLSKALGELGIARLATQISEIPVEDQRISLASSMPTGLMIGGRG